MKLSMGRRVSGLGSRGEKVRDPLTEPPISSQEHTLTLTRFELNLPSLPLFVTGR